MLSLAAISITLSTAAGVLAATDWAGLGVFITAVSGFLLGVIALVINRRGHDSVDSPPPAPTGQVAEIIKLASDLKRAKDERDQARSERNACGTRIDELVADVLAMNDELGEVRRAYDRCRREFDEYKAAHP